MWKTYAEVAAARLSALAAYLKTKQGTKKREGDDIASLLEDNLRPAMFKDPDNEREVQDVVETIFRVRSLDFRREQETVAYSTKRYILDFTFDSLGLAVEIKLCKRVDREKEIIDEINADIVGYRGACMGDAAVAPSRLRTPLRGRWNPRKERGRGSSLSASCGLHHRRRRGDHRGRASRHGHRWRR